MARCSAIEKSDLAAVEAALLQSKRPHRDACLFALGVETGLRISELLSIKFSDVFDAEGRVRDVLIIEKAHCKGKQRRREIPLSPVAKTFICRATSEAFVLRRSMPHDSLFAAYNHSGPISRQQAYKVFSAALQAAGITKTRGCHTMRKTFATLLLEKVEVEYRAGRLRVFPLLAVQLGLGHQDLKTTQRYLECGIESVNEIIKQGVSL
jgi:integrase